MPKLYYIEVTVRPTMGIDDYDKANAIADKIVNDIEVAVRACDDENHPSPMMGVDCVDDYDTANEIADKIVADYGAKKIVAA